MPTLQDQKGAPPAAGGAPTDAFADGAEELLRRLWRSDVPSGRVGEWAVERFEVHRDPPPAEKLAGLAGPPYPPPARGTYTRLRRGETPVMTDTPDEWLSHRRPVLEAARRGGRVLVNGLGLGLVVETMLRSPFRRVERLTVVELAPEVIALVGRHLERRHGARLEVVHADAFTWEPPAGARFSVVWHDLWPRPGDGNRRAIERLERRYRGCCEWQGAWGEEWCAPRGPDSQKPC